ncbi:MAG: periplasmic heavy metal sensor [Alphaproteobacteria bacterium]|nr:periplasmic heavy metal sensor [Alphaproteobacteria bacterium]
MKLEKIVTILGAGLFISMSANLFMGGLMLGHNFTPRHAMQQAGDDDRDQDHANWRKRDEELRKKLSEGDRRVLRETMQANRDQFQGLRQKLKDAQQQVQETLNAQPFDKDALSAAMGEEQRAKLAVLEKMHGVRDALLQKVSPEGRAVLEKTGPFSHMNARRLDGRRGHDDDRRGGPGDRPDDRTLRDRFRERRMERQQRDGGDRPGAIENSDRPFLRDGPPPEPPPGDDLPERDEDAPPAP